MAFYNTLLERVRTLSADDPHIIQRIDATETAIHEGDYDRAEQLINEISRKSLTAARELQDIRTKRLLTAAKALGTNGALKNTQLVYAAAANYYRQCRGVSKAVARRKRGTLLVLSELMGTRSL